ncbi:MAG: carboxylesterase family protein, partial [Chloracidobacterium sp.]|nr:carboxylesterase family protein [Chloracidobacterium sp.]
MLRNLILLAIGLVFVPSYVLSGSALTANDTVRTEGGLISGSIVDGVRSYKGIPYAAPPVGDLRWKSP